MRRKNFSRRTPKITMMEIPIGELRKTISGSAIIDKQ
tara:strand:+ start:2891 stop:3001 length:111 start_codon:yes stop_codon:yes gene_type:complete